MTDVTESALRQRARLSAVTNPSRTALIEHGVHGREIAVDVREDHRLGMQAELRPGDDFHQFVEGAHAARQADEGIGHVGHERLALVHGGDHVLAS